jgi:hypothetical protein
MHWKSKKISVAFLPKVLNVMIKREWPNINNFINVKVVNGNIIWESDADSGKLKGHGS